VPQGVAPPEPIGPEHSLIEEDLGERATVLWRMMHVLLNGEPGKTESNGTRGGYDYG
jgi:hypothetical protein